MVGSHVWQCCTHGSTVAGIAAGPASVSTRRSWWVNSILRTTLRAGTGTVRPLIDAPDGRVRHSSACSAATVSCHSSDKKMNGTPDSR